MGRRMGKNEIVRRQEEFSKDNAKKLKRISDLQSLEQG